MRHQLRWTVQWSSFFFLAAALAKAGTLFTHPLPGRTVAWLRLAMLLSGSLATTSAMLYAVLSPTSTGTMYRLLRLFKSRFSEQQVTRRWRGPAFLLLLFAAAVLAFVFLHPGRWLGVEHRFMPSSQSEVSPETAGQPSPQVVQESQSPPGAVEFSEAYIQPTVGDFEHFRAGASKQTSKKRAVGDVIELRPGFRAPRKIPRFVAKW